MALEDDIRSWDGRSADAIARVFTSHERADDFVSQLMATLSQSELQAGATWLLKRHVENGGVLSSGDTEKLLRGLALLEPWEARLHVLQCFEHIEIPPELAPRVADFLRDCLTLQQKFVRAWAYSGFYHLARQHPAYAVESDRLLQLAAENESASVRARIRRLKSPT